MRRAFISLLSVLLALSVWLVGPFSASAGMKDDLRLLQEIMEYLERYHIDRPDHDLLVENAIRGIVDAVGDPYTYYLRKDEVAQFLDVLEGRFVGIGIELQSVGKNNYVYSVFPESPAQAAGIQPGDVIYAVDGERVSGEPAEGLARRLEGSEGTMVKLTVRRDGRLIDFALERRLISLPPVGGKLLSSNIAYIRIRNFSSSTADELKKELLKYCGAGVKGLIVDLRGNEGGLIDEVAKAAGYFLGENQIVAWLEGRDGREAFKTTTGAVLDDISVAVLIDSGTASAAEMLAGALKDSGVALLFGEPTYGKGSVQELVQLKNGGALRFTTERYLTPSGWPVDGVGIAPDLKIETPSLVPLVAEAFLTGSPVRLKLEVGSVWGDYNGKRALLPAAPAIYKKELCVPLRFIAEAFGYEVFWDSRNGVVLFRGEQQLIVPLQKMGFPNQDEPVAFIPLSEASELGIQVEVKGNNIILTKKMETTGDRGFKDIVVARLNI